MPGLFPTPDSGLRVLSRSEWVAPPLEGRGLAFIQGRLTSGKQAALGLIEIWVGPDAHQEAGHASFRPQPLSLRFQSCTL